MRPQARHLVLGYLVFLSHRRCSTAAWPELIKGIFLQLECCPTPSLTFRFSRFTVGPETLTGSPGWFWLGCPVIYMTEPQLWIMPEAPSLLKPLWPAFGWQYLACILFFFSKAKTSYSCVTNKINLRGLFHLAGSVSPHWEKSRKVESSLLLKRGRGNMRVTRSQWGLWNRSS